LQIEEYARRYLRFKRSVYGSAFFILTGFHGLHVTIGAIALRVVFIRFLKKRFSSFDHVGFEGAA
jgi:cytochrome c oxidase subunit 3